MATMKQKLVAREIKKTIENNISTTGGLIVEKCGYGKGIQKSPGRALKSKGVKEELAIIGFSEKEADTVVGSILIYGKKEENQLKAADMIYKRTGGYAPEKHVTLNVDINLDDKTIAIKQKYEDEIRKSFTKS